MANKVKRGEIEQDDAAERVRRQQAEKAEADRQREAERKAERGARKLLPRSSK